MNQLRIHGDPCGDDAAASLLRSFLRLALGSGMRCALSPVAAAWRDDAVATRLPACEADLLAGAVQEAVAATAPVLVFASPAARADAVGEAGLRWPRAIAILPARDGATAAELLERVRAELRWAGSENLPHALEERELLPWLALPVVAPGGPVVCVTGDDRDDGVDLAIATWRRHFAARGVRLRIVVTAGGSAAAEALRPALGADAAGADVVVSGFDPAQVRDAAAIVLPWRSTASLRPLVLSLASGRPVCVSHFAAMAVQAAPGTCLPVAGRSVDAVPGRASPFEPDDESLRNALQQALAAAGTAAGLGRRARVFVREELVRGRPAAPPASVARTQRPVVVLEAPFLADAANAAGPVELARVLCRRDRVDVRLVVASPLQVRLGAFRERAGELVAKLCRDPGTADLWLACGGALRAGRPPCRTFARHADPADGTPPAALAAWAPRDVDVVLRAAGSQEAIAEAIEQLAFAAGRGLGCAEPAAEPVFSLPRVAAAAVPAFAPPAGVR